MYVLTYMYVWERNTFVGYVHTIKESCRGDDSQHSGVSFYMLHGVDPRAPQTIDAASVVDTSVMPKPGNPPQRYSVCVLRQSEVTLRLTTVRSTTVPNLSEMQHRSFMLTTDQILD
jgi:hypothetical protein